MKGTAAHALAAAFLVALPAGAQVDGLQLQRFQREAQAVDDGNPDADRFRAGFFKGYVAGVLDALEGRNACFRGCRCDLEAKLDRFLADHPEKRDVPAATWLPKLVEEWYPCPR
jgi:hypothetical protein